MEGAIRGQDAENGMLGKTKGIKAKRKEFGIGGHLIDVHKEEEKETLKRGRRIGDGTCQTL